jgi:hypothetical protein
VAWRGQGTGWAGKAGRHGGEARRDAVWHGKAWLGLAWHGMAAGRRGMAWHGQARLGKARRGRRGKSGPVACAARPGKAWQARRGMAGQGEFWLVRARQAWFISIQKGRCYEDSVS